MIKLNKLFFIVCIAIIWSAEVSGQSLTALEDSIQYYLREVATLKGAEQNEADERLQRLFRTSLLKTEVFQHPFSTVNAMSILTAPNGLFRIFNWNVPLENGTYRYNCFIVTIDEKKSMCKVFELKQSDKITQPETSSLSDKNWLGALYFDIIPVKSKGNDYYLLLGWDGNTSFSNKKLAETLYFQSGRPKFGLPVFKNDKKTYKRLQFEYKEDAVFSIGYYEDIKTLVFDHLGPLHPSMEGQYSQYVPMQNFDGYVLTKGKWEYKSDIDFKRSKKEKHQPYNDPAQLDMNQKRSTVNPLTGE
jgi:hypothetical protein